ncbi:MAG: hypothetical protein JXA49_06185 [Actinobacteria bacterium]|nr:hypothetical protein [Actinomycetota bacterium]
MDGKLKSLYGNLVEEVKTEPGYWLEGADMPGAMFRTGKHRVYYFPDKMLYHYSSFKRSRQFRDLLVVPGRAQAQLLRTI